MKHVVSWAPCLAQASPGETPPLRRFLPTLSCPTFPPSESLFPPVIILFQWLSI